MFDDTSEIVERVRVTPNRGDIHVFLGHPLSDDSDKTTVEPGGAFSPGLWTCGISLWIEREGVLYCAETQEAGAIRFGFAGALPPILQSQWSAGEGLQVDCQLAHLGDEGTFGVDFVRYQLRAHAAGRVRAWVVVRDVGPAGGKIDSLQWDSGASELRINDAIRLSVIQGVADCHIIPAGDLHDSPMALIGVDLHLSPDDEKSIATQGVDLRVRHGFARGCFAEQLNAASPFANMDVDQAFAAISREWDTTLPARVFAPDQRIAQTWEQCAYHLLAASECGLPRIGTANYPVLWMRDSVIVLRAMDIIGRHDLARLGATHLAPICFSGGFGAEADAPGEGIWALVQHGLMQGDTEFLREIFPHIQTRVVWIERMLTAEKPIREVGHNRIPFYINAPAVNVLCAASAHGLVQGRMDWHSPNFYINCWCYAGLINAAMAAERLGHASLADTWCRRAGEVQAAIGQHLLPHYGNERDMVVAPHPTLACPGSRAELRRRFAACYKSRWLTADGQRKPERLWTYFEAAAIHNAILLDHVEMAWINLDGMLSDGPFEVHAYAEGNPGVNECLPFNNGNARRGWLGSQAVNGNMPHNWTTAEMLLALRTIFVDDSGDVLVIGRGVPQTWITPGSRFGVREMPTRFGKVSFAITVDAAGHAQVEEWSGPSAYHCRFPAIASQVMPE